MKGIAFPFCSFGHELQEPQKKLSDQFVGWVGVIAREECH